MEGVCITFKSVLKGFLNRLKGVCKAFEKSLQRVCRAFASAWQSICKEFEIICPRVCMLIKAILVTIIKTRYVKLFGTFLFGFGGFDNHQSVVCFLIVILNENSERETSETLALKNVLLADRNDKSRTIKSLTHAT